MRTLFALFLSAIPLVAGAAGVSVRSLYDDRSLVPGMLLPFEVQGGVVGSVSVTGDAGGTCRVMIDPFRKNVFHAKCATEADIRFRIRVVGAAEDVDVNYGPVNVRNLAPGLVAVDPDDGDPSDALAGKQLFGAHCVNCHNPASVKKGRTAAQISSAIQNQPSMNKMDSLKQLTADQLRQLEAYLKDP